MMKYILIRGGGDLASGVALRLHRSGFKVIITELPKPLAVRRTVSFSEAVYMDEIVVEGLSARLAHSPSDAFNLVEKGHIPVLIDPQAAILREGVFPTLIDARLLKHTADSSISSAPLVIGLGPGFTCGQTCHAVVETQRGHFLGRVYWSGSASPDTGIPEGDSRRVLRAPLRGILTSQVQIGDHIESGQTIAQVDGEKIIAPFAGVIRGLIRPGVFIEKGVKIGDIDQRDDPEYCFSVSDKALAIAGGVLEAILSHSMLSEPM
ncbi:MAG: selenium-dependent molybdenum cofactor biosynthesis protein YqeB [Chloroflexi bacterium]|nr:selenium-dependent molybdenum cofactor biosynthesis protein YqeB [Chloroflexota bacterium]